MVVTNSTSPWRWLSVLTVLLAPSLALAQDPDTASEVLRAEQARLQSEIQRLAERETWDGVERTYLQLLELEAQGLTVTYAEHVLGAQAAQARGDVQAIRARLEKAIKEWETPFATEWLNTIDENYGQVTVEVSPRFKELLVLRAAQPPFQADARAAIEFAQKGLDEERQFTGWLPSGDYTLGARQFTISADEPTTVDFGVGGRTRTPRTRDGGDGNLALRLRVGGGFGGAGAPQADAIQPPAFGGFSPQLGVGGSFLTLGPVHIGAELGYLGALAGAEIGSVNLGYGWLFAGADVGDVTIEAGPLLGLGQGRGVGIDPEARQRFCAQNDCPPVAPSADVVLSGGIRGAGLGAGASIPIGQTGPLGWSAGAHLGGLNDASRWYPWAQLNVTAQLGLGDRSGS